LCESRVYVPACMHKAARAAAFYGLTYLSPTLNISRFLQDAPIIPENRSSGFHRSVLKLRV